MKRDETLNLRVPPALKKVLVELAERQDRSVADQVIAMLYQALLSGRAWEALPADAVWAQLLRNLDALPARPATEAETEEFRAFRRREDAGKSEKLTTAEALALLGEPEAQTAASNAAPAPEADQRTVRQILFDLTALHYKLSRQMNGKYKSGIVLQRTTAKRGKGAKSGSIRMKTTRKTLAST